jgi:hypothetical protein
MSSNQQHDQKYCHQCPCNDLDILILFQLLWTFDAVEILADFASQSVVKDLIVGKVCNIRLFLHGKWIAFILRYVYSGGSGSGTFGGIRRPAPLLLSPGGLLFLLFFLLSPAIDGLGIIWCGGW